MIPMAGGPYAGEIVICPKGRSARRRVRWPVFSEEGGRYAVYRLVREDPVDYYELEGYEHA